MRRSKTKTASRRRALLLAAATMAATAPFVAHAAAAPAAPVKDIRILIDVSGSMKWNDPQNLRVPALRLVTGLLPRGSRAGVWTFGRYVNMLIPYAEVDGAWKNQALQAAATIGSQGLYTDIEAALEKSTWDWTAAVGDARSVIVLTDGLVDVAGAGREDAESRSRILGKILPRLQRAGATVYAIALSGEADDVLLQQLAVGTNGWFEKVETAESLERIFFRMFEKAADPDTLPLAENTVLVDESIRELTLLIFRRADAPPTTITTPAGDSFGEDRPPPNARWHRDARYDLVTVEKPAVGSWKVNAEVDSDNRVMVVTDLRMISTELPNNVGMGDEHMFFIRLTDKGRAIEKKEFLHFVKVLLTQESERGGRRNWTLLDNGRDDDAAAGDGIYSLSLRDSLAEPGRQTFTVEVDGTTFKRSHRQTIEVVESPVIASIKAEGRDFMLFVVPRPDMINADTMEVSATIASAADEPQTVTVPRAGPTEWRLPLTGYAADAAHHATLEITAERPSGRPLAFRVGPLDFGTAPPTPHEPAAPSTVPAAPAPAAALTQPVAAAAGADETAWAVVALEVVLINLVIGAGIFFGYKKWRALKAQPLASEELLHE